MWGLGTAVLLCVAALAWLFFAAGSANEAEREKFMADCERHEQEYRCTAMWRAGNNRAVAIPIVVPVAR